MLLATKEQKIISQATKGSLAGGSLSELLSEAWREHKQLTSIYILMLSMGIENAQNIFLIRYF